MSSPYRDPDLVCPACRSTLRSFQDRLCCDECNGIFVELADLERSIAELTGATPSIAFTSDHTSPRKCPRCSAAMVRGHIDVHLDAKHVNPRLELDRCPPHGVWFDDLELAKLFERVHGGVSKAGYGHGIPMKIGKKTL